MRLAAVLVLVAIVAVGVPTGVHAQTANPTGTWRMDGEPGVGAPFPFEVVLRVTEADVRGRVSACPRTPSEISNGRIDGNVITFTCSRDDRFGSLEFTGVITNETITLQWHLPKDGTPDGLENNSLFGERGPSSLMLRRAPDGELAKSADEMALRVRGREFSGSVNLPKENLRVIGTLFVPDAVNRVRTITAILRWGSGTGFYADSDIRRLAERTDGVLLLVDFATLTTPVNFSPRHDGSDALLLLLDRMSRESGHAEIRDAPLVLWGHSAATAFPSVFAGKYPERTIAFVRYHAGSLAVLGADVQVIKDVPGLFVVAASEKVSVQATSRAREYWQRGRLVDAAWTLSVDSEGDHGSAAALQRANSRMIPWMEAVIRRRLPADGSTTLRKLTDGTWLADFEAGEIAPSADFRGTRTHANWFPDEQTARQWRAVIKSY